MILRYLLPALGGVGLIFALIFTATYGNAEAPKPNQLSLPPSTPYQETVSGTGLVEASSRNIEVGSHLSGIIWEMRVKEGDEVKQGDILFSLDTRQAQAELALRESEVKTARVAYEDQQDQLKRVERLKSGRSVTLDQLQRRRFAARQAEAQLDSAKAARQAARVTLERLVVTAPVAGCVLKVRVQKGEFVSAGGQGDMPLLMGADHPLYLRVQVDENDVWRFRQDAAAVAALRSNKEMQYPLTLVRVEPYVQPKQSLSGDNRERVDTRVLEVVYQIGQKEGSAPLYIGQQMDVFINAGKGK